MQLGARSLALSVLGAKMEGFLSFLASLVRNPLQYVSSFTKVSLRIDSVGSSILDLKNEEYMMKFNSLSKLSLTYRIGRFKGIIKNSLRAENADANSNA